jgi:hypothetical protein
VDWIGSKQRVCCAASGAWLVALLFAAPAALAQSSGSIQGTITDAVTAAPLDSASAPDLIVLVYDVRGTQLGGSPTNASGLYTILGLAPGTYYVKAISSSHVSELHDNIPCVARDCVPTLGAPVAVTAGGVATVDIALSPGGGFSGAVRRAGSGAGIAGVTVTVFNASTSFVKTIQTAADGTYSVGGLPAGAYFARASNGSAGIPGAIGQMYGGVPCPNIPVVDGCRIASGTPITVAAGATTPGVDFALNASLMVNGGLFERATGLPITNARVDLYMGAQRVMSVETGSSNFYAFIDLPPGAYRIRTAVRNNYVDEWYGGPCVGCPGTPATITLAGAPINGLNLTLSPGGRITGAISCTGIPGGGIPVTLLPIVSAYNAAGVLVREFNSIGGGCTPQTPTLQYAVEGLLPGQYYLVARDPLALPSGIRISGGILIDVLYPRIPCVTVDCDPRRGVPVTVPAGGVVTGIDFISEVGASSALLPGPIPPFAPLLRMFDSRGVELTNIVRFAAGFFNGQQATGIPPGTYYATLGDRLHGVGLCASCPPTAGRPIVIQPGQESFALDFGAPPAITVSGTVSADNGGTPLSTITVQLLNAAGALVGSAITDAGGRYTIVSAGAGSYYLRTLNDRGFVDELYAEAACGSCDVRLGTPVAVAATNVAGIDFALAEGGLVSGRVTGAGGSAVNAAPVSILTSGGTLVGRSTTAADGSYRVAVPAGAHRARLEPTAAFGGEIFSEQPCTSASCDATAGDPVNSVVGTETANINFTPSACSAMTLSPDRLATGVIDVAYRQVFTVSGGTPSMAFRITGGTLPAGVSLTPAGVLEGTPTTAGRYEITVSAIDANGCAAARPVVLDVQQCIYRLSPSTVSVRAEGANVPVVIGGSCGGQTVTGLPAFVTVLSNIPSEILFNVAPNTATAARSASITIGRRVLVINQSGLAAHLPFGTVDGPLDGAQVSGSVAVGGWALDDLEVRRVEIFRDPVGGEPPAQVYLGNAVFVAGARPDVAAAYPGYPRSDRAGWGFLILTNLLPNQGNGVYRIYAYAEDVDGLRALLGARTIVASNATSTLPFGAIDTPTQGATIKGTAFINFGWALTPQPKIIPTDGSTIHVLIDGVSIGPPVYNQFRSDIATFFPGLANSGGAVGYRVLDTTALAEGQHTIAWIVADSQGAAAGIGSRYFSVANSADAQEALVAAGVDAGRRTASLADAVPASSPLVAQRAAGARRVRVRDDGSHRVTLAALERLELQLEEAKDGECRATWAGYLVDDDTLTKLPAGSTIDPAGTFYWQPGPGFAGTFEFVFVRTACDGSRQRLAVEVSLRQ